LGLRINDFAAFSADTYLFSVLQALHFDAYGCHTLIAHQHYVGPLYGSLTFDNATLTMLTARLYMPFYNIDIFNHNPVVFSIYFQHFADLTLVFTGNNSNFVVLFYTVFFGYHNSISYRPPKAIPQINNHPRKIGISAPLRQSTINNQQ
jgi:hypothetical protein